MAGVWPWSELQIHDQYGKPLAGARAYFVAAATLDPIRIYQDFNLGVDHANPVMADAWGIFPVVYLDEADEWYRFRITTAQGVVVRDLVVMPVIGPASAAGTTPTTPVDPNALIVTGDVVWNGSSALRPGYVRCNGRTIGSAISGATERAHGDTQSLFGFLWNGFADSFCPVSGGRGANSAADWSANKQVGLLDLRGRALFGFDSMGNTAAGRLTSVSGAYTNTPGGAGGSESVVIAKANLPNVTLTITGTAASAGAHVHNYHRAFYQNLYPAPPGGGYFRAYENRDEDTDSGGAHTHTVSGTTAALGSGTALVKTPPFMVGSYFIKL